MSPRHKLINIGFSQTSFFFFLSFLKREKINKHRQHWVSSQTLYKTVEIVWSGGSFDLTVSALHLIRFKWFDGEVGRGPWESFASLPCEWCGNLGESKTRSISLPDLFSYGLGGKNWPKLQSWVLKKKNLTDFLRTPTFARTLAGNLRGEEKLTASVFE